MGFGWKRLHFGSKWVGFDCLLAVLVAWKSFGLEIGWGKAFVFCEGCEGGQGRRFRG